MSFADDLRKIANNKNDYHIMTKEEYKEDKERSKAFNENERIKVCQKIISAYSGLLEDSFLDECKEYAARGFYGLNIKYYVYLVRKSVKEEPVGDYGVEGHPAFDDYHIYISQDKLNLSKIKQDFLRELKNIRVNYSAFSYLKSSYIKSEGAYGYEIRLLIDEMLNDSVLKRLQSNLGGQFNLFEVKQSKGLFKFSAKW